MFTNEIFSSSWHWNRSSLDTVTYPEAQSGGFSMRHTSKLSELSLPNIPGVLKGEWVFSIWTKSIPTESRQAPHGCN